MAESGPPESWREGQHTGQQVPHVQQVQHTGQQPQHIQQERYQSWQEGQHNWQEAQQEDEPGATWVRLPKPWPLAARLTLVAVVLFGLIGGAIFLAINWVQNQIDPAGNPGREVAVAIPQGASTNDIARILAEEDVVANSLIARFLWRGDGPYQAGDYTFRVNMSLNEAEEVLSAGPNVLPGKSVTVPEGLWLIDISDRLLAALPEFEESELSQALYSGSIRSKYQPEGNINLEGLLFPDTYQVGEDDLQDEAGLLRRMVAEFESVADSLGYDDPTTLASLTEAAGRPLTAYEVIVVASMVEEEARVPSERAKIARVIYNRIRLGMRLEIDATVLYAMQRHTAELTAQDLNVDSPYNTRRYPGLPPTPIAAPGKAALEAALNPEEGNWIFYVLSNADGSHFFTDSYDKFLEQVNISRAEGLF